jgi:hypothetical protein
MYQGKHFRKIIIKMNKFNQILMIFIKSNLFQKNNLLRIHMICMEIIKKLRKIILKCQVVSIYQEMILFLDQIINQIKLIIVINKNKKINKKQKIKYSIQKNKIHILITQ